MKFASIFVLFACIVNNLNAVKKAPIATQRFSWPKFEYSFEEAGLLINKTAYNSNDFSVIRSQVWKDKLFIAQNGNFFSANFRRIPLTYVDLKSTEESPKLIPYPKDLIHNFSDISALKIDVCDRLWFIDGNFHKLYIINLNENKVIRTIEFNPPDYEYVNSMTIDVNKSDCDNAYAYIVSMQKSEIIVYGLKDNKYWLSPEAFIPNNLTKVFYSTALTSMQYYDTAVAGLGSNGSGILFLKIYKDKYLVGVPTRILQNSKNGASQMDVTVFGPGPDVPYRSYLYYDERNTLLFFKSENKSSVGCWNTKRFPNGYSSNTTEIITMTDTFNETVFDIQSDENDNLLILTVDLQSQGYAYKVYTISIKELVKGTVCDVI